MSASVRRLALRSAYVVGRLARGLADRRPGGGQANISLHLRALDTGCLRSTSVLNCSNATCQDYILAAKNECLSATTATLDACVASCQITP